MCTEYIQKMKEMCQKSIFEKDVIILEIFCFSTIKMNVSFSDLYSQYLLSQYLRNSRNTRSGIQVICTISIRCHISSTLRACVRACVCVRVCACACVCNVEIKNITKYPIRITKEISATLFPNSATRSVPLLVFV